MQLPQESLCALQSRPQLATGNFERPAFRPATKGDASIPTPRDGAAACPAPYPGARDTASPDPYATVAAAYAAPLIDSRDIHRHLTSSPASPIPAAPASSTAAAGNRGTDVAREIRPYMLPLLFSTYDDPAMIAAFSVTRIGFVDLSIGHAARFPFVPFAMLFLL